MSGARQHRPEAGPSLAEAWAQAGAACGSAVSGGAPITGISGDEGDGFFVPLLPVPKAFAGCETQGERENCFRAYHGLALRCGQAALKAADKPSLEAATKGVVAVLDGTYKPGRERDNDIVERETTARFAMLVRNAVLAKHPQASEADIEASIAKQAEKVGDAGMSKLRASVLAGGTYTVTRKGKSKTASAIDVDVAI